jgi:glycosyltransferase involved in cell wall biosynthesis
VLEQTVLPDEILIGDDCSSDNTRSILVQYKKKHPDLIRLLFHEQNLGIAGNLNTCVREAKSSYIGFLAGDDWLIPNKNEVQFKEIKKYGDKYGLYFSDFFLVYANTKKVRVYSNIRNEGDYSNLIYRRLFSIRNFWLKKELFLKIGGFEEELFIYEDWHFRLKLSLVTKFKKIPGVFSVYYSHEKGIHNVSKNIHMDNIKHIYKLLDKKDYSKKNLKLLKASIVRREKGLLQSLWYDLSYIPYRLLFKLNIIYQTMKYHIMNREKLD